MARKKKTTRKGMGMSLVEGIFKLAILNHLLAGSFAASNTRKETWSYIQFPTSMRQKPFKKNSRKKLLKEREVLIFLAVAVV